MAATDMGIPLVTTSDGRLPGKRLTGITEEDRRIDHAHIKASRIVHNHAQTIMTSRTVRNLGRESNGLHRHATNVGLWSATCMNPSSHLKTRRMRLR